MGFFTFGNLITLGIVAAALFLYRQLDKENRSLDKVRKYADKCKEELASYAEEKGAAVKDFGIALDVERKSATELMRRLQVLTEQELAQKTQAISRMEERLKNYDSSMEDLAVMAERVQENMGRIREESAFVENAGRRVTEAKEKLEQIEKSMGTLENRFERENSQTLKKISETLVAAVSSTVSNLEMSAGTVEKQVEEHRQAIEKIERQRAANMARDTEIINKTLKEAVERAGVRADKMEEAALVKLREQAQERLNQLKSTWEEKIKSVQENVKTRLADIQEQLKSSREGWKADCSEIESRQKLYNDEWKKNVQELDALAKQQKNEWTRLSAETEQSIIAACDERLEEYKEAQALEFKRLGNLADDSARLEEELRRSMEDATDRVNGEFSQFSEESRKSREAAAEEFNYQVKVLQTALVGVEEELAGIKNQARENVSEKLKLFEDDFFSDLGKRSSAIEVQLSEWQDRFNARLDEIAREGAEDRKQAEVRINGEHRKNIAEQGEKLVSELERLKAQAAAFEEGIREEMRAADESRLSFMEQLSGDLEEARSLAAAETRSQIGQYNLTLSETLRQSQRELEGQLREMGARTEARSAEIESTADTFRRSLQDWQNQYSSQMRDMDTAMEEARRRIRETAAENDERLAGTRAELDLIRKELSAQSKLFDQAGELKHDLESRIEDLKGDFDRLEQRKAEIVQIENQFLQIKRLEDDVNAKMTRFLSEKRRIEVMENDFNRLLLTSQSVEERLTQVTSSDDILQNVQVQIRRLEDSIRETDEKYQRVERKGQILEETSDGISKNFKALQESETAVQKAREEIQRIFDEMEVIKTSVGTLARESEKARDASDKLDILDSSLGLIEKRIAEMQVAREWLARTETELQALDKDAQTQLRLTRNLLNREGGKASTKDKTKSDDGALTPSERDNILRLRGRGWTVEEIANTMNRSKGEVELVLELGSRD